MRPADAVAFFGAIADAAKKKQDEAKREVIKLAAEVGTTNFKSVGGSKTTIAEPKPKLSIDPDGLLRWVQAHQPHNIEPHVRPAAAKRFEADLVVTDNGVFHGVTGELLDFVESEERQPYVSWTGGGPVKDQAYDWMTARADELLSGMERTYQGQIEQTIDAVDLEGE